MATNKRKQKAFKEFQKKRHFISRSRILIKDAPEKDGIMLIRRGVPDIRLNDQPYNRNYEQMRIVVDKNHWVKGLAMYGKDSEFPKGVDVIVYGRYRRLMPSEDHYYNRSYSKAVLHLGTPVHWGNLDALARKTSQMLARLPLEYMFRG